MKINPHLAVSLVLLLITFKAKCQDYIVTVKGDTVVGEIKNRQATLKAGLQISMEDKVKFVDQDGSEHSYKAGEILAYSNKGTSFSSIEKPALKDADQLEPAFGEVLVSGKASLHRIAELVENPHYDEDDEDNYPAQRKVDVKRTLILRREGSRPIRLSSNKKPLFTQLAAYLSDNESLVRRIQSNEFKKNQIEQIILIYNQ